MHHQFNEILLGLLAWFTFIVGFLFDVPAATLWTAASGAFIGLAFSPATSVKYGVLLVFGGAASVGWLVPFLMSDPPSIPQKSIAFVLAVLLISSRNLLPEGAQALVKAGFERAIELIKTLGKKP